MTTNNQTPEPVEPEVEKKPNFLTRVRTNHPRKFKAAVITAGALLLGGGAYAAGARTKDDDSTPELSGPESEFDATDATSEA